MTSSAVNDGFAPSGAHANPRCLQAIRELSACLTSARLATIALERWCRERRIGDGRIVARRIVGAIPETLDDDSLRALDGDIQGVAFRKVQLVLGGVALVDAMNWYFPARLTPDMRRRLQTTDCPFGEAIEALGPRRRTFFVRLALPEELGCALLPRAAGAARNDAGRCESALVHAFEHRVLLHRADGAPLAVVHEKYRTVLVCEASLTPGALPA